MGALAKLQTVHAPARIRAESDAQRFQRIWRDPHSGFALAGGANVSPETALMLSHVYSAVDIISGDFGSMTCQLFGQIGDKKSKVRSSSSGIGKIAFLLRWQANSWQTAKAFWSTLAWQYLLRPACYAEMIYREGSDSYIDEIIPRHPDRVKEERLPSGRIRFKMLYEPNGPRYVTQDEMFVVRNTSTDGINALSRIAVGGQAISTNLALQDFTRNYFERGATAALIATYKGGSMEPTEEEAFHARISRFMNGVENAGGIFVSDEDFSIANLGVEPEKAQLLGLKNIGGRDIARLFKVPAGWLQIEGAQAYNSAVQDSLWYSQRCQLPIVTEFDQAIQMHIIVAPNDQYFAKHNMDVITRATLKERMEAYEIGIRSRVIRPSEARDLEDRDPDEELDELSAQDHRAGSQKDGADNKPKGDSPAASIGVRAMLMVHDSALRVLRRERLKIETLAKKHADDPDGWKIALKDFYTEHAQIVSRELRIHPDVARAYAAQHGHELETNGAAAMLGPEGEAWERHEAEELTTLAISEGDSVDGWFNRRLTKAPAPPTTLNISTPVAIADGAVRVDARTTVEGPSIDVKPAAVTIGQGAIEVTTPVHVTTPKVDVTIKPGAIQNTTHTTVEAPAPVAMRIEKSVTRGTGGIEKVVETHTPTLIKPRKEKK